MNVYSTAQYFSKMKFCIAACVFVLKGTHSPCLAIKFAYCIVSCSHDCSRNVATTTVRSMPLAKHHLPVCGGRQCYRLEFKLATYCNGYKWRYFYQHRQLRCNCWKAGKWTASIKPVLDSWPSYSTLWGCSGIIQLVIFQCWYVLRNFYLSQVSVSQIYTPYFLCNLQIHQVHQWSTWLHLWTTFLPVCLGLLIPTTAHSITSWKWLMKKMYW